MADESNSRFSSLDDLQHAHVELMKTLRPTLGSGDTSSAKPAIIKFVERAKNTGACIQDTAERQAGQNILDYWSAETVSVEDISKDWTPEKLLPFDPEAGGRTEPSAERLAARLNARKKIQLAAAARLWKDSGQATGYLLNGSALAEAEKFAQEDREIKDLVFASRTKVSAERRNTWILVVIVFLLAIIGWLLIDRTAEQRKLAQLEAQRNTIIAERSAARDAAQVDSQEAKIRALTQELRSAKLSAPAEITETVPEAVVRDQAQARISNKDPSSAALRGFIWLGSDAAPNLLDSGGAPVKPSVASVGGSYSVSKNLVLRTSLPSADYIQGDSAGIVPEQTTIKLVAAPVPYKRPAPAGSKAAAPTSGAPSTTVQYWAQIEVSISDKPIVYIEYAASDATNVQTLGQKLKSQGFRVPGVEPSDLAKGINEIHFYFADDKTAAERLSAAVNAALKELQWSGVQAPKVVDMTSQKGPRNFPGVLELWIDISSAK